MADMVQFRLEQMSDELDDLEHRGLFTSAELAEVVRRRRDFEFRLRRHSPHKDDFLDYIAYLLRVDALRDLRKRAIIRAMPDPARSKDDNDDGRGEDGKKRKRKRRKEKWAKSVSVSAGVRRVLDVYRMATVRFKGDLDLWFRYLEFCRQKGHGRMKQICLASPSSVWISLPPPSPPPPIQIPVGSVPGTVLPFLAHSHDDYRWRCHDLMLVKARGMQGKIDLYTSLSLRREELRPSSRNPEPPKPSSSLCFRS